MNPVEYGEATRALEALEVASHLSVVCGTPDEAELAALVAGIAAAAAANTAAAVANLPDAAAPDSGAWHNRAHQRGIQRPGPEAWRWSSR